MYEAVEASINVIKTSAKSCETIAQRKARVTWKRITKKCKTYKRFWETYCLATVKVYQDGAYQVYSAQRAMIHNHPMYKGIIKEIELPSTATPQELGQAVLDVIAAAEEKDALESVSPRILAKELQMLNGSKLVVTPPNDAHFEDLGDCGAAEIYQCYSYVAKEGAESSGEFYVGMAVELDCNLEASNIRECWEELYGMAECFEVKEIEDGIFKLRAEMRNKEIHRISYLLCMEESLILECTMNVNQPNRRKKLDEKLCAMFEKFVYGCNFPLDNPA